MAKVLLKTNKGDITLSLDAAKAPKSVANFLEYVKDGFYNNTPLKPLKSPTSNIQGHL